jgi:hypothetical protein
LATDSAGRPGERSYDFTQPGRYPRSGREKLGGIMFLARAIDKMRAHVAGTVGEYNSHRGMSSRVFDLFGVTAEQFEEAVRVNPSDEGVLAWLQQHGRKPSQSEIDQFNATLQDLAPNEEMQPRFRAALERMGHGQRTDVRTWLDMQDLDEGRLK